MPHVWTLTRRLGWYWGRATRRRCRNCATRAIHTWRPGWPRDYLCERCGEDPKVRW